MMNMCWRVVDQELLMPVDDAEWWGASLGILVAAIHHPWLLAARQPGTDAAEVAREVLVEVGDLHDAWACAHAQAQSDEEADRPERASVRRDGDEVVFSPGTEVANLAWCLEIFATGVLDPTSREAEIARGATAYAASAWSGDIGKATGAL